MLFDYAREAIGLAEEGVAPERVDRAMKDFGMAMGPFAMFDLSGLDVFWHIQQGNRRRRGSRSDDSSTGSIARSASVKKPAPAIYRYEKGSREPIPDPVTIALLREEARKAGIAPRPDVSDDEIVQRFIGALIAAGDELLRERRRAAARRYRYRLRLRLRIPAASRRPDVVRARSASCLRPSSFRRRARRSAARFAARSTKPTARRWRGT